MTDKLDVYRKALKPLPKKNFVWPLYGAGLENLGLNGQPIDLGIPEIGPDELIVRHDACGLCFSDIKVIKAGETHPRIYRKMNENPVVLGHEIAMTVVKVGNNLKDHYSPGDRFTIQADIFINGTGYAYGYEIQGGLSEYNVIDQRVLNGDDGNYLLPVKNETGYAESALTEPWACVIAAYQLKYRTSMKHNGIAWIIGTENGKDYFFDSIITEGNHPKNIYYTNLNSKLLSWLQHGAERFGYELTEISDVSEPPTKEFDDIILLGSNPEFVETTSQYLADFGVYAIISEKPFDRKVSVDVGRIHYNRWVFIGASSDNIAEAYTSVPVRSTIKPGGQTWFVGAGGPMGRMHVQRAIQLENGPKTIVCSDVSDLRLDDLCVSFAEEARAKGIKFICLNPFRKEEYLSELAKFSDGFDDIIVLAPIVPVIAEAAGYLANQGVMNVFAGLSRGTKVELPLSDAYLRQTRVIGHSASTIDDLRLMLHQTEEGVLSPNRSVAAIGSLAAAKDGLMAVQDTSFPGKVVIFPHIREFPLTSLPELKEKLPSVFAFLKDEREWTKEAEDEFLREMLP